MEQKAMLDALVQAKRMGNLLNEVQDLSQQLAEAIDRDDRVSIEMLVSMRREPIDKLVSAREMLDDQVASLPAEDAGRLAALLDGGAPEEENEDALAKQLASNRRRLERVLELDKRLNQKLTREKSVYGSPG